MMTPKVQLAPSTTTSDNNNYTRVVRNPYAKQRKNYPSNAIHKKSFDEQQLPSKTRDSYSQTIKTNKSRATKTPPTNHSIKNVTLKQFNKNDAIQKYSPKTVLTTTTSKISSMHHAIGKNTVKKTSVPLTSPNKNVKSLVHMNQAAVQSSSPKGENMTVPGSTKEKVVKKKKKATKLSVAAQLKRDIAKLKKQKALAQEQRIREATRLRKQKLERQKQEEKRLLQKEKELRQQEKIRLRQEKEALAKAKREEQAKRKALEQTLKEREEQHQLQERKEKLYRQLKEREAQETKKMNVLLEQTPKVTQPPQNLPANTSILQPNQISPPTTILPSSCIPRIQSTTVPTNSTSILPPQQQPPTPLLPKSEIPYLSPPSATMSSLPTNNMPSLPSSISNNPQQPLLRSAPEIHSIERNDMSRNHFTDTDANTKIMLENESKNHSNTSIANVEDYSPLNYNNPVANEEKEEDSAFWDSMIEDLLKPTTKEEEALVMTLFQQEDGDDPIKNINPNYNTSNNPSTLVQNWTSSPAPYPNYVAPIPYDNSSNCKISSFVTPYHNNPLQRTPSSSTNGGLTPYSAMSQAPNSITSYNYQRYNYPYHAMTIPKSPYNTNNYFHPTTYHNNINGNHHAYSNYNGTNPSWQSPLTWNHVSREATVVRKPVAIKELRLCEDPLSHPSPFSNTHVALSFKIVLKKKTLQDSFGVNVRYHTKSVYLITSDNEQVDTTNKKAKSSNFALASNSNESINESQSTYNAINTNSIISATAKAIAPLTKAGKHSNTFIEDKTLPSTSSDSISPPKPTPLNEGVNKKNEDTAAHSSLVLSNVIVPPFNSITANSKNVLKSKEATIHSSKVVNTNSDSSDIESLSKTNSPLPTVTTTIATNLALPSITKNTTTNELSSSKLTAVAASVLTAEATVPKKKKKRKTYGVMTVVNFRSTLTTDDEQNTQNNEIENEKKLFPGDIILSMEGTNLGGKTFSEACQLFPKAKPGDDNPTSTSDNNEEFVTCTMMVAREKKVMSILSKLSKLSHKKVPKNKQRNQSTPKKTVIPSPLSTNETTSPLQEKEDKSEQKNVAIDITVQEEKNEDPPIEKKQLSKLPNEENNTTISSSQITTPVIEPSIDVKKEILLPIKMIPLLVNSNTNKIVSGEFSVQERIGWIQSIRSYFYNDLSQKDDLLDFLHTDGKKSSRCLEQRDNSSLSKLWEYETNQIISSMKERADLYWKQEWENELNGNKDDSFVFLSDTQRSTMRCLPRPIRGCKCGSKNHEHVNDIRCPLYRNIRNKSLSHGWYQDKKKTRKEISLLDKNQLNGIRAAFFERYKKMKEAKEKELEEAIFVQDMERLQLSKEKKAVFAPRSLAVMILSTIAHLNDETNENENTVNKNQITNKGIKDQSLLSMESGAMIKSMNTTESETKISINVENDCNADGMMLGKRSNNNMPSTGENEITSVSMNKKRRIRIAESNEEISISFLTKMLSHISQTWGHVFKEPDHLEFAWDTHLVTNSKDVTNLNEDDFFRKNPRQPGTNSFESIRFVLGNKKDSSSIFKISDRQILSSGQPIKKYNKLMDDLLVFHLASDEFTGVWSELKNLMVRGIVTTTACHDGVSFSLSENWDELIPQNVVYDMWESGWHRSIDRGNKFLLDKGLRETLCRKWTRMEEGLVFSPAVESKKDKIVYSHEKYFEKRRIFEEKFEDYVNEVDGVGKFGF